MSAARAVPLAALVLALALAAAPASAAQSVHCALSGPATVDAVTQSTGALRASGPAQCTGFLDTIALATSPGTFSLEGTTTGRCEEVSAASATLRVNLPRFTSLYQPATVAIDGTISVLGPALKGPVLGDGAIEDGSDVAIAGASTFSVPGCNADGTMSGSIALQVTITQLADRRSSAATPEAGSPPAASRASRRTVARCRRGRGSRRAGTPRSRRRTCTARKGRQR